MKGAAVIPSRQSGKSDYQFVLNHLIFSSVLFDQVELLKKRISLAGHIK